jgi:hypothetical protein
MGEVQQNKYIYIHAIRFRPVIFNPLFIDESFKILMLYFRTSIALYLSLAPCTQKEKIKTGNFQ